MNPTISAKPKRFPGPSWGAITTSPIPPAIYGRGTEAPFCCGKETPPPAPRRGSLPLSPAACGSTVWSEAAITFTTAPDTTDATTYTGTLSTSGLDILDAWLYGDLESAANQQRAEDDLHSAKNTVDLHLARLKGALATAQFYESQSNVQLDAFAGLIDGKTTAHLLKLQEAESGNTQQNSLNTMIINAHRANSALYLKMFSGTPADALSQTRVNMLV